MNSRTRTSVVSPRYSSDPRATRACRSRPLPISSPNESWDPATTTGGGDEDGVLPRSVICGGKPDSAWRHEDEHAVDVPDGRDGSALRIAVRSNLGVMGKCCDHGRDAGHRDLDFADAEEVSTILCWNHVLALSNL